MNIVICAIAKNENKYINEWAKYYFNLGFNHIYLYDNNFKDYPYVGDCFDDDIKDKITIFDVQNICGKDIQERSYNNFYQRCKNNFDWCLFCDIDEFLDGIEDIQTFLSQEKFKEVDQIRIKWKLFGDDNCIERDESIPVYKFFRQPILDNIDFSNQGKALLRGSIQSKCLKIKIHMAYSLPHLKSCLPSGKVYNLMSFGMIDLLNIYDYEGETIYLNHYKTKTLKEFLNQKYDRTECYCDKYEKIDLNYYFQINQNTPEKQEYIKKWLKERRK